LQPVFEAIQSDPATEITVGPEDQAIKIPACSKVPSTGADLGEAFEMNGYKKTCLLNGYDDIDYLLSMRNEIVSYEQAGL
jgi:3-isopropylmalate/(R)-2-methylmalate dehydratase small subunit